MWFPTFPLWIKDDDGWIGSVCNGRPIPLALVFSVSCFDLLLCSYAFVHSLCPVAQLSVFFSLVDAIVFWFSWVNLVDLSLVWSILRVKNWLILGFRLVISYLDEDFRILGFNFYSFSLFPPIPNLFNFYGFICNCVLLSVFDSCSLVLLSLDWFRNSPSPVLHYVGLEFWLGDTIYIMLSWDEGVSILALLFHLIISYLGPMKSMWIISDHLEFNPFIVYKLLLIN